MTRETLGGAAVDRFLQDVGYALRLLRRSPGFTAAGLVTLALGIGATTAVFSVVYGVLLKPLPFPNPDRIVRLSEEQPGGVSPLTVPLLSNWTFDAWRRTSRTLTAIAAYREHEYTVRVWGEAQRIRGCAVSPGLFALLGTAPQAGRFFAADEDRTGADRVVVLSDGLWRERFDTSPHAVGSALVIDGEPYTVVGIARAGLAFPDRESRLWTPFAVPPPDTSSTKAGMFIFSALGRLAPGANIQQAAAEGTAAARSLGSRPMVADLLFGVGGPVRVNVHTLVGEMTAQVRPALLVLAAAVVLVLLIACANVANLFLSRGVARQRELALRAAIGASSGRLARQLLTESGVLSFGGGVLGLLVGWMLLRATPALAPASFPRLDAVRMDGRVLLVALAASLTTALLAGLAPAMRGTHFDLASSLHSGGEGAPAGGFRGARARRLRDILLVLEAAFAATLLVGASLLGHSFLRLVNVDAGYDTTNVLTATVYLPEETIPVATHQFVDALLDRLRSVAGVTTAGAGSMMPFGNATSVAGFTVPPEIGRGKPTLARALRYSVTPGYAEALGLRLKEGRFLAARDAPPGPLAMMVNERFAREYLAPGPVAGLTFTGGLADDHQSTIIVGLVGNVLKDGNNRPPQAEVYLLDPQESNISHGINVVIKTAGDPAAVSPALRAIVRDLNRNAAVAEILPLADRWSASVDQPRFATTVLATFAALALVLASVGLYGVRSFGVAQRKRELGVRAALGARRRDLIGLVLREGLALTVLGVAIGLGAAAGLTRLLQGLLFGVAPLDTLAFAAAPLILLPIAILACALPARRAAAADPAEALRCE